MPHILTAVRRAMEHDNGYMQFVSALQAREGVSLRYRSHGLAYRDWERAMTYGRGESFAFRVYQTENPVEDTGFFRTNKDAALMEIGELGVVTWFVGKQRIPDINTFCERGDTESMIQRYLTLATRRNNIDVLREKLTDDARFRKDVSRRRLFVNYTDPRRVVLALVPTCEPECPYIIERQASSTYYGGLPHVSLGGHKILLPDAIGRFFW